MSSANHSPDGGLSAQNGLSNAGATQTPRGSQLYIFLIAVDVLIVLIYFFLVPSGVWESYDSRLRSIGALIASIGSYIGLRAIVQKYATQTVILGETWLRILIWLGTMILLGAVLPFWSVRLNFSPTTASPPEITISAKTRVLTRARDGTYVVGGLLLRTYDVSIDGVRDPIYLPAVSILANKLTGRSFLVQLPCALSIVPAIHGEHVYVKRNGRSEQEDLGTLNDNGILWLMPGRYDYLKITNGSRAAQEAFDMHCPQDRLEIAP